MTTRHELVKAKQCCREIKDAAEKIIELNEGAERSFQDLAALMKEAEPQKSFERMLFDVIRNSHNMHFAGFHAELLEQWCDARIPQAASRERVDKARRMTICNGGAVSEIPVGQTMRGAGVDLDLVEAN
jgi:hypothetical protein